MKIALILINLFCFHLISFANNDVFREAHLKKLSEADGVKFIGELRIPFNVPNSDLKCYGWNYNPGLDSAIIQYSINGDIEGTTMKETLASRILNAWENRDIGRNFRAMGFKDIAVMITYKKGIFATTSTVYSSAKNSWYTVDDYTALSF